MPDYDCREIRLLLDAYHDGEVQPEERDIVDSHIQGCEACRSTLSEIQFVAGSLSKLPTLAFKADFADRLERKIVSAKSGLAQANCAEFEPLLDAFFDGELDSAERQAVSAHAEACEKCTRTLADIGRIAVSLKAFPAFSLHRDVAEEFDSILAERKKVVPLKRSVVWITAGIAAGFALIVFAMQFAHAPLPSVVADATPSATAPHMVRQRSTPTAPVEIAQLPTVAVEPDASAQTQASKTPTKNVTRPSGLSSANGKSNASVITAHATNPSPDPSTVIAHNDTKTGIVIKGLSGEVERDTKIASMTAPPLSVSDSVINKLGADDVIAVYDAESNPAEELGMSTDEDGLYAIKL
jgi:anti-sigma factor RsiW